MSTLWLLPLILGSTVAIAGGQKPTWRLLNLFIILSCSAIGYGIGYVAGLGRAGMARASDAALPFSMVFWVAAAFGCIGLNNLREK